MKATCALVLFVSLQAAPAAAQALGSVRAMDPDADAALAFGRESSMSFRRLADAFDDERVVVHVVCGETRVFGTTGATRLASTVGAWRYVRIVIDPRLRIEERTAVLGHELQHAREIVEAGVTTQDAVRVLYERIGRPVPGYHDAYETSAAADAGNRVWRELRQGAGAGRATSSSRTARSSLSASLPASRQPEDR
jgi:hypothetical protein